jgi:hypothetical protein
MTSREILEILRNDPKLADKVFEGVPALQTLVIRRKFGINRKMTNRELAKELGVTPSYISLLIKMGLSKITHSNQRIQLIHSSIKSEDQKKPEIASRTNRGGSHAQRGFSG